MALRTSTTGSWPPIYDPNLGILHLSSDDQARIVRESTERAIHDQIEIGLDVLVDGEARGDVVSRFAKKLPGLAGDALPFHVTSSIRPSEEPISVQDYLIAKELAGDRPLKAQLTGPMTMARATFIDTASGYQGRNDPELIRDLARALGQEARFLVEAGAEIIQIDEPVLADGVDLDLAFEAMELIRKIGEIPFPALHACGNVTRILDDVLTRSPVKMISIESSWLRQEELGHVNREYLMRCGKQIGLGCIQVSDHTIERLVTVQNFLDRMVVRLGEENIWAVMPNCGLRLLPHDVALDKLNRMVEAVRSLS